MKAIKMSSTPCLSWEEEGGNAVFYLKHVLYKMYPPTPPEENDFEITPRV
jgi:hypothetical protein